jgi:3-phytase
MPSMLRGVLALLVLGAGIGAVAAQETRARVAEAYVTAADEAMNIDSVAAYPGTDGRMWLLATAKTGHVVRIYDAATGAHLRDLGKQGAGIGEFSRPNGVLAEDGLLVIVERDNHRVQVFALPSLAPLGVFAAERLVKPYGAYLEPVDGDTGYRLYVTDNYELADESIPPDAELGRRVSVWNLAVTRDAQGAPTALQATFARTFGETSGPGVLRVVESIWGDPANDRLLIAEEDPASGVVIKVYGFNGRFRNEIVGEGLFKTQPEGIQLFTCGDGGYWIATDQDLATNVFHLFDRRTLRHVGAFEGNVTRNTDGIGLTQRRFGPFRGGALFAVHDDQAVAAFDSRAIARALGLPRGCR